MRGAERSRRALSPAPTARARARRARARRARLLLAAVLLASATLALVLGGGGSGVRGRAQARSGSSRSAGSRAPASPALTAARRRAAAARLRALIAGGSSVFCGAPRGHALALTFDDGPGPYTRLVLAKLRKHGIRATFFLVGRNLGLVPGAPRQERELGAVGDHTWTHPLLTSLAAAEAEREIVNTQAAVARAAGGPVELFRPPYGAHDASVDAIARRHGLLEVLWSVDSADSLGAGYSEIERNVIAGMRPGAIILMHENHGQTVRALLGIFAALQRRHLHAVSLPELLSEDPPSAAQLRAGRSGCGPVRGALTGGA